MSYDWECSCTEEIICPYCKHEYDSSWELNDMSNKVISCESCGRKFKLYVNFEVDYTTEKFIEEKTQ